MGYYSDNLKEAMVKRLLPPEAATITQLSKETGITRKTLRNWKQKYSFRMKYSMSKKKKYTKEEKLSMVFEYNSIKTLTMQVVYLILTKIIIFMFFVGE